MAIYLLIRLTDVCMWPVPRGVDSEEGLPTCPVFKEIGQKFAGGFDLAMIPIGAVRISLHSSHCLESS